MGLSFAVRDIEMKWIAVGARIEKKEIAKTKIELQPCSSPLGHDVRRGAGHQGGSMPTTNAQTQ
jgi:hypothetical protein